MKRNMLALLVVTMVMSSAAAWAGRNGRVPTQVDLTRRNALGSVQDTRASFDDIQYIGCTLLLALGDVRLHCEARDADPEHLSCRSNNPEVIKIGKGVSEHSLINFTCDANDNILWISVSNNSMWLP